MLKPVVVIVLLAVVVSLVVVEILVVVEPSGRGTLSGSGTLSDSRIYCRSSDSNGTEVFYGSGSGRDCSEI